MRQDTNVLSNPWRWLVIAVWVFFLLIAIGIVTESAPEIPSETDRTISTVMGIGMILGALYVLFITWRKRVVLSRDAMLVCRGVRTTRYPARGCGGGPVLRLTGVTCTCGGSLPGQGTGQHGVEDPLAGERVDQRQGVSGEQQSAPPRDRPTARQG